MASPRFPAAAMLLDAKVCSLDTFDELFVKITQERQIQDGYFLQVHPDEAQLLFVVNGSPYAAGRVSGEERATSDIADFFTAYAQHPQSPLSFFVADKRLLLGLMVLCHHPATLRVTTDGARMEAFLEQLAMRPQNAILALHCGDEWAVSIFDKGRPVVNYFPTPAGSAPTAPTPAGQLLAYVESRPRGEAEVEVFEETRVWPASDAAPVPPEARHHLSEVFRKTTASEKDTLPLPLEAAPQFEIPRAPEPTPGAAEALTEAPAAPSPVEAAPAAGSTQEAEPLAPEAAPGPPPEVLLYFGDRHLGTFSLAGGELTIGRSSGNDIMVDNAGVSRRHAVIRRSGGRVSVEDLGSANGTMVNGKKVATQELHDADEVTIVKHRLVLHVPKEGEAVKPEAPEISGQRTVFIDPAAVTQALAGRTGLRAESATPVLRPRLILPDLKKFALEDEEVTLGSGPECSIQLSGMFVAKLHARIIPFKEGQYKIVHLAGLSGTRVNGGKISERILKHGDEIEIGKSRLLYRIER